MEQEREIILNKIKRFNFEFETEEKALLKIDEKLASMILEEMKKDKNLKNAIIRRIIFGTTNLENKNIIKIIREFEEEIENFSIEDEEIDMGIFYIDKNSKNWDKLEYKIKNKKYELKSVSFSRENEKLNEKFLEILLENNRYDLVNKAINELTVGPVIINESFLIKLLNEYPSNEKQLNINKIMIKDIDQQTKKGYAIHEEKFLKIYKENIKKFPLQYILETGICEGQTQEEWLEIVKEKILNPNENIDMILNKNEYTHNIVNIIRLIKKEDRKPIIEKALEKESTSFLLSQNYDYDEKTIKKICELLKEKPVKNIFHLIETSQLNNKEFCDTLIEYGYDAFASYCIYYNEEKSIQTIKKLIKENKYENIILSEALTTNDQIIQAIIENILQSNKNNVLKILPEELLDYQKQIIYTKIANALIKNEKYDNLEQILEQYNANISMTDLELNNEDLKEKIKKSLFLANLLFKKYRHKNILDKEYRNIYINKHEYFIEEILDYIKHQETLENLYDEDLFNQVKRYLTKKYDLDPGHLETLKNKFGTTIIKYIDNEKLGKIINLEYPKFKKLIELFPQQKYNEQDLKTIYDSFKQEEFSKKNSDIKNIFPNIVHMLQEKDSGYIKEIYKLKQTWDEKIKNKIIKKYPEQKTIIEKEDYFKYIANKLITTNASELEKYIDIIHIMTDYYIAEKREEYRKTYDMQKELNMKYTYDEKDITKEIIKLLLKNDETFKKTIIESLLVEGINNELANEIIDFYITKNIEKYKDRNDVKKNTNKLLKTAQNILTPTQIKNFRDLAINQAKDLKKKYIVAGKTTDIYKILSNIRIEILEEKILDEAHIKEYETLKKIIKKYKLDTLPQEVETLISKDIFELKCNIDDISTFISFFYDIHRTEQKKNKQELQIINIFKYIEKYSAVSSVYSQILGKEDASIIRQDPPPHSSSDITKEQRLNKAVEKTLENFRKTTIKIPAFITEVKTSTEKTITAIVGNFTKPTNLTHGERTGACMRIGGVGETLFNSQEAFHIEFNEPNTEKYISRVTGFRNGNTVFLNELRNTCDEELYQDIDIVEACKNVAELLIEKSKTSTSPIENVVIHRAYAMECIPDNRIMLDVQNIKQGLSHFYSDVGTYVHVLATTNKPFTPVVLDNSQIPEYKPARERIKKGNNEKIVEQINRIHSLKEAIETNDYKGIIPISENIQYGIVGEDFYVYINDKNEVKTELIERDIRALDEYNKSLEEINEYIPKEAKYAI